MTITSAISDLFFNYQNVHWAEACNNEAATRDDIYEAIKEDAKEFLELLSAVTGHTYDNVELAEDFLARV